MNSKVFLVSSLFALLIAGAVSQSTTPSKNTTLTTEPTTNSTVAPATNSTVAPATNSTVAPATNTTTAPTKTTPKVTTAAPTSTTPAMPSNTYEVHPKGSNATCIKMQAEIEMSITYLKKEKGGNKNETVTLAIGKDATSSGECGNNTQTLDVMFNKDWQLSFVFERDGKTNSDSYSVSAVTLLYTLDSHFPDAVKAGQAMNVTSSGLKDYLKSAADGYYVCNSQSTLDVQGVQLNTKDFKYKAFNEKGDIDFKTGTVSECSADEETNSIVPIAVGAALAGLVVIVLIAYLIGRKRTRKTGYESV